MRRAQIVITGAGLATSLGVSVEQTWRGILESRQTLGPMPALETPAPAGKGGYQAADLPGDFAPHLPREVRYLRWTILQAIENAEIGEAFPYAAERCGFVLGTTLHGMRAGGRYLRDGNAGHLGAFLAGSTLQQAVGELPFSGDAITTCSACSSSLGSIALAATLLEMGELDLIVAGGYDTVSEYAYAGFNSLRLVADGPLRPFARGRLGMKLGEGYGMVVLERAVDARNRGAKPLATILGCGESADAHHLTQPHPQGIGAAAAIGGALVRAGLKTVDIDLIAAHATGTPDNDLGEHAALSKLFGSDLPRVPVVGFKSHIGHTLGGAGAVELILSAVAMREQIVPATANVKTDEIEFEDLSVATGCPRSGEIRATLNTSLGFGGANTCAILGAPHATELDAAESTFSGAPGAPRADVFITGIGIVLPGAVGAEAFIQQLAREAPPAWGRDMGPIAESEYVHLLNARRVRRMNDYVKSTLAATTLACEDAGIADLPAFAEQCSAVLGTAHGGSTYCLNYYRDIVKGGMIAANPMLFAEGVPNAAAAHLSLMLSLKGACQTVIGTRTAGLDALRLASLRIASGQWDRAIVGAAEEHHEAVNDAYRHCGLCAGEDGSPPFTDARGFRAGAGAITFVLESRQSLEARGGRARGRVVRSSGARAIGGGIGKALESVYKEIGSPGYVLGSANGTWVDRAETAAIGGINPVARIGTLYGALPELFSVGPLASVAHLLLEGPAARAIFADGQPNEYAGNSYGVICTGYSGTAAGVTVSKM